MDRAALQQLHAGRFFAGWDGDVEPGRVEAAELSLRSLVAALIALGPRATEAAAREAVETCVGRFNDLDDGWIDTIEREDICEAIGQVVDAGGWEFDEDWVDGRDW